METPVPDRPFTKTARAKGWMLIVVAVVVGLLWWRLIVTPAVSSVLGFASPRVFLDLYGPLAAREAAGKGMNPYALNPLDSHRRPHLYADWWLIGSKSGVWRHDTLPVGVALAITVGLASLAIAATGGATTVLVMGIVLVSPAVLFAIFRSNIDLVIFVVVAAALGCMTAGIGMLRRLGAVLIAIAAVLKYYPLAGLVVLLSAPNRKSALADAGLAALVVALGVPACLPAVGILAARMPKPSGWYTFGAGAWARTEGVLLPTAVTFALLLVAAVAGAWILRPVRWSSDSDSARYRTREIGLVLGCAMLAACFALDGSFAYKGIFVVWTVPWLFEDAPAAVGRLPARWLQIAMIVPTWFEGALVAVLNISLGPSHQAFADRISAIGQPLWWAQYIVCAGVIVSWATANLRRLSRA